MNLKFFCPLWGSEHLPFENFLQNVKADGYDGVEMGFALNEAERNQRSQMVHNAGLMLIAQHWETIEPNFEKHCTEYETRLRNLAAAKPLFINTQTGKDYYSFQQNKALFDIADKIASDTGIEVLHETHRGKWSFAAHIAKDYLQKLPALKITFDVSHWCNTAESFLQDQPEAIALAIKAARHIHARVGHAESPQVIDPRFPEWQYALQAHIVWWDAIIDRRKHENMVTITPEFGAFPYLVKKPNSNEALVNQWEINVWMMNHLKERYNQL